MAYVDCRAARIFHTFRASHFVGVYVVFTWPQDGWSRLGLYLISCQNSGARLEHEWKFSVPLCKFSTSGIKFKNFQDKQFVLGSKLLQSQNQVWLESKTALWSQRLKELRWQSSLQLQLVVWKSSKLRATSKVAWARSDHPVTSVSTFNSVSHRGSLSTTSAIKIIRLIQRKS